MEESQGIYIICGRGVEKNDLYIDYFRYFECSHGNLVCTSSHVPRAIRRLMNVHVGGVLHDYSASIYYRIATSMYKIDEEVEADLIFLGDSHMFYGEWENWYNQYSVLNRGIGSDTCEGVFNRIEECLIHNPKVIFMMVGINDICFSVKSEESLHFLDQTFKKISDLCPSCRILLFSVLPTASENNTSKIGTLNSGYKEICSDKENAEFIDIYDSFCKDGKADEELFSDGLHLNYKGYYKLRSIISERIKFCV